MSRKGTHRVNGLLIKRMRLPARELGLVLELAVDDKVRPAGADRIGIEISPDLEVQAIGDPGQQVQSGFDGLAVVRRAGGKEDDVTDHGQEPRQAGKNEGRDLKKREGVSDAFALGLARTRGPVKDGRVGKVAVPDVSSALKSRRDPDLPNVGRRQGSDLDPRLLRRLGAAIQGTPTDRKPRGRDAQFIDTRTGRQVPGQRERLLQGAVCWLDVLGAIPPAWTTTQTLTRFRFAGVSASLAAEVDRLVLDAGKR